MQRESQNKERAFSRPLVASLIADRLDRARLSRFMNCELNQKTRRSSAVRQKVAARIAIVRGVASF